MVIWLEQGADLHMAQLMPLPLTVSCFSKIHIGFFFLVLAHPGSPRQRAIKRVCVCPSTEPDVTNQQVNSAQQQLLHSRGIRVTYRTFSSSQAWRKAWWSQCRTNINGASSSCIPCIRTVHGTEQLATGLVTTRTHTPITLTTMKLKYTFSFHPFYLMFYIFYLAISLKSSIVMC